MEGEPTCFINPFAPEPPEQIQIPSTACDIISFNGQGRLCLLTFGGWRDVSNHAKMSTIQWRKPEKKAKKKNMERGQRKQLTFGDASIGFPSKWRLINERRDSRLTTRHSQDLGGACDWLNQISHVARPIRSITQILIVTRHQYGISALVSQTSFGGGNQL